MGLDSRGISEGLGYVFSLVVLTTFIFGGLYIGINFFSESSDAAKVEQAEFTAERLAATIENVDREVRASNSGGEIKDTANAPDRIGGEQYTIKIESTADGGIITINLENQETSVSAEFASQTPVTDAELSGGRIEVIREDGATELSFVSIE